MKKFPQSIIAMLLLIVTAVSCTAGPSVTTIKDINTAQLLELQQKGAVVIDVRTPKEWDETGIIPGAKKVMYFNQQMQTVEDQFLTEINKIITNTDKPVVLYCRSGGRSGKAAKLMAEKNLVKKVYSLDGGMKQWLAEGKTTEK